MDVRRPTFVVEIGTLEYYLFNAHGDVVQRVHESGEAAKSYRYDAFGVEENPEPLDANPFRYCGEYFDGETGEIYLRARYYSPGCGRFCAEDPLREKKETLGNGKELINVTSLNLYLYCNNNAVLFSDPTGMSSEKSSLKDWWDKEPEYVKDRKEIPSYTGIIEDIMNFIGDKMGDFFGWASGFLAKEGASLLSELFSSVQKQIKVLKNYGRGEYPKTLVGKIVPKFPKLTKAFSKLSTGLLIAGATLDVANTWTADSGNTNGKRIIKTGVQLAGAGLSLGTGALSAAAGAAALSVTASPALGIITAFGLGAVLNLGIDSISNWSYNALGIK